MSKGRFCEFQGTTEKSFNENFFKSVMELDYKDWRISYRKAEYIYENKISDKGKPYIEIAKEYIDESIQLLSINKDTELDSVIGIPFILLGLKTAKENKVYLLAGQIYAQLAITNNKYKDNALKYYQKYQVFQQKYKLHEFVNELTEISVYSFRPLSEYALADLANDTITVSRPSRMNDPFDSLANLWKKSDNLKNITKELGHEDIFAESMDYFRIRSFSLVKDDEVSVLGNIRMWSAYANNHQGFCIRYKLNEGFINHIDTDNLIVRRLAPIKYVYDCPMPKSLTAIDSYEAYNKKHECWAYENEIRLLSYNTGTDSDFFSEPMGDDAEIEEVIFGLLCPKEHMEAICNILRDKKVVFFKMTTDPRKDIYTLKKKKYSSKGKLCDKQNRSLTD